MLSDFDLAKQSSEPGCLPAMVHSESNGVNEFPFVWTWMVNDSVGHAGTSRRYDVVYGAF
jgi:hypothetical protein